MFDLSRERMMQLFELLASSDIDFVSLRTQNIELTLRREGLNGGVRDSTDQLTKDQKLREGEGDSDSAGGEHDADSRHVVTSEASVSRGPKEARQPVESAGGEAAGLPQRGEPAHGYQYVRSPHIGSFFRAPEPGAPSFVDVGDRVHPGTTVGLIEAMKLFTAVTADIDGTIRQFFAQDGELVEYGEVLMAVEILPDAPDMAGRF